MYFNSRLNDFSFNLDLSEIQSTPFFEMSDMTILGLATQPFDMSSFRSETENVAGLTLTEERDRGDEEDKIASDTEGPTIEDPSEIRETGGDDFPGDTSTTGVIVIGGDGVAGNLEVEGDDDWFAIEIEAGQTVRIDITGDPVSAGGLDDPFARLRDAAGDIVAFNDDIVLGSNRDSSLLFTASESGTYYLSARAFGDDETGTYVVSAREDAPANLLDAIDWGTDIANRDGGLTTINVFFQTAQDAVIGDIDANGNPRDVNALQWTEYEMQQVLLALDEISNYINVEFVQVNSAADADFRLIVEENTAEPSVLGFFFPPLTGPNAGTGVFNRSGFGWDEDAIGTGGLERGGFGYVTIVHELGHGLGLAHPHDTGGTSVVLNGVVDSEQVDTGDFDLNQSVFTIMSYVDGWATGPNGTSDTFIAGWQSTFAAIDIAVLQEKYGANTTFASGNDTYTLASSNTVREGVYETIWDTGGIDEITASTSADAFINLRFATLTYENGGGGFVSYTDGIIGGFTIAAGAVIENATGAAGNDQLVGNETDNVLDGQAGNDQFFGGGGNDQIIGGAGNDTVILAGSNASEYLFNENADGTVTVTSLNGDEGIDTLSGIETIRFGGTDGTNTSLTDAVAQSPDIQPTNGSANNDSISGNAGNNFINGLDGGDTINGLRGDDILNGGAGDDSLNGGTGNDTLNGGADNDNLRGAGGNDILNGGDGNDTINSGSGSDTVDGGNGNDTILAGGGDDTVLGGDGNDTISGGSGVDNISGGNGGDTINGGGRGDILDGEAGNDTIDGDAGNDMISGGQGNDTLLGGFGADELDGGSENDSLNGEAGADILTGGLGIDTFIFTGNFGADTVTDFVDGIDRIDFSGQSSFNALSDVMDAAEQSGANVVITLDASNTITLENVTLDMLDASDFIF